MMSGQDPRADARQLLDRLRVQIELRLPATANCGGYAPQVVKIELPDLAEVASILRDFMAAERDWHELPDAPAPGGDGT